MSRVLTATIRFLHARGGLPGPGLVEAMFEDPRPLHPPRNSLLQVSLQPLAGAFQIAPWLDGIVRSNGWCQEHARTLRCLLSPGGRTISRAMRFCKRCHHHVGLHGLGCLQCGMGTERGAGQFDSLGRVFIPPRADWHRVFGLQLRHVGRDGPVLRYVDVLLADCVRPVYVQVCGQAGLDELRVALEGMVEARSESILAPGSSTRPLLARDVSDDEALDGLIRFLEARATVIVEEVQIEPERQTEPEHEGQTEFLVVADELVPVTGYDWRDPAVAERHVRQTLECLRLPCGDGTLSVPEVDVETVYIPVGLAPRQVQPFFCSGSTLRVHLYGSPSWRQEVVRALHHHGLRSDSSGPGIPISVYPVAACDSLRTVNEESGVLKDG